jgi:hypothetical protein
VNERYSAGFSPKDVPGRQWCAPGLGEVLELLIEGAGVALGHLVKDCRHGKTVGGLCREGRVERKEHSYREYDVKPAFMNISSLPGRKARAKDPQQASLYGDD